jgi:hypothetical protein
VSYFGRRWTLWGLAQTENRALVKRAERQAVNAPVQGWAADYMKYAMLRVARRLKADGLWGVRVRMVMNQHDALVFEVSQELSPAEMVAYMRPLVEFDIPGFPHIDSEWEFGYRYGSLRKLDERTEVRQVGLGMSQWAVVGETGVIEREEPQPEVLAPEFEKVVDQLPSDPEPDSYGPGVVIVDVPRAPLKSEVLALRNLCLSRPGPNRVVLRTAVGESQTPWTSSLGPDAAADVSLALPGASVYYPRKGVDMTAMAEVL